MCNTKANQNIAPNNIASIDMMKILCALLVIAIHVEPFSFSFILDKALGVLTRIAVPFFFIASAFFYFQKPISLKGYLKYAKRILLLYFIWITIYVLFEWLSDSAIDIAYLSFQIFIYGYRHFWYLLASVIGIGICSCIIFFGFTKFAYVVSVLLYIWGTLNSTYSVIFSFKTPIIDILGARNGIYYAPLFIMIGYYFTHNKFVLSQCKKILLIIFLFALLALESGIGVILFHVEATILWFITPILMFILFSYILEIRINIPNKIAYNFRKLSIGIYCIHPMLIRIFEKMGIQNISLYIIVSVTSFLIIWVIYILSQKKTTAFFKYLL